MAALRRTHRAFCALVPTPEVLRLAEEESRSAVSAGVIASGDDGDGADACWCGDAVQRALLSVLLRSPPCSMHPPPMEYVTRLAKRLAAVLESANVVSSLVVD